MTKMANTETKPTVGELALDVAAHLSLASQKAHELVDMIKPENVGDIPNPRRGNLIDARDPLGSAKHHIDQARVVAQRVVDLTSRS